jgi:hypothetical protein
VVAVRNALLQQRPEDLHVSIPAAVCRHSCQAAVRDSGVATPTGAQCCVLVTRGARTMSLSLRRGLAQPLSMHGGCAACGVGWLSRQKPSAPASVARVQRTVV